MTEIHLVKCDRCGKRVKMEYHPHSRDEWQVPKGWEKGKKKLLSKHFCPECVKIEKIVNAI